MYSQYACLVDRFFLRALEPLGRFFLDEIAAYVTRTPHYNGLQPDLFPENGCWRQVMVRAGSMECLRPIRTPPQVLLLEQQRMDCVFAKMERDENRRLLALDPSDSDSDAG